MFSIKEHVPTSVLVHLSPYFIGAGLIVFDLKMHFLYFRVEIEESGVVCCF